jgi:SAM-dependent methyltransferase
MNEPPPLDAGDVDALRDHLGLTGDVGAGSDTAEPPASTSPVPSPRWRQAAKRVASPVAARVIPRIAIAVQPHVTAQAVAAAAQIAGDADAAALRAIEPLVVNFELLKGEVRASYEAIGGTIAELRAEIAGLRQSLDDIGFAIAPGAGPIGVADRFAEIRSRLNQLDRDNRAAKRAAPVSAPALAPEMASAPVAPPPSAVSAAGATVDFDYVGFEQRFRGAPEEIAARTMARYVDVLRGQGPVLDVGCGRGEFLAALAGEGIDGTGVDIDEGMVDTARAAGVDAHHADALTYLEASPEAHYGAICAIQVVEHLDFDTLLRLVDLAASRLRPGGLFIAETPNPSALFVLGNTFLLDPSHVRPIHPSLLVFLCERAGFAGVDLRFEEPLESHFLPLLDEGADQPEWVRRINESLRRLNTTLFGPQDYAVVARAPA